MTTPDIQYMRERHNSMRHFTYSLTPAEIDALFAEIDRLTAELASVTSERDAAKCVTRQLEDELDTARAALDGVVSLGSLAPWKPGIAEKYMERTDYDAFILSKVEATQPTIELSAAALSSLASIVRNGTASYNEEFQGGYGIPQLLSLGFIEVWATDKDPRGHTMIEYTATQLGHSRLLQGCTRTLR